MNDSNTTEAADGTEVSEVTGEVAKRVSLDALTASQWKDIEQSVIAWRRHLHENPELSFQEHETTDYIRAELEALGYTPTLFRDTGLYLDIAETSSEHPQRLAIRADIDALPIAENTGLDFSSTKENVAHACGHDGHTAIVMGVAKALKLLADTGEVALAPVRLLFQPAEETVPGGAKTIIEQDCLADVGRIMAVHLDPNKKVGELGTRTGPITSSNAMLHLRINGDGGHSARPHMTQDVIHAMAVVITGVNAALDRRLDARDATALTWGRVEGGVAGNAIPGSVELQGTLRSASVEVWVQAEELVREIIGGLLAAYGIDWELEWVQGVPPVDNDGKTNTAFNHAAAALEGELDIVGTPQSSGGEDFAWYLRHVPGAMARLGTWDGIGEKQDLHQPDFCPDERAFILGTKLFTAAALEWHPANHER